MSETAGDLQSHSILYTDKKGLKRKKLKFPAYAFFPLHCSSVLKNVNKIK